LIEPLKAIELPIRKIFSPDYAFRIPNYQRPYSWTADQVHELFNDLTASLGQYPNPTPVDEMHPYFMGSIVLIKDPARPEADIVDGQQRLTTVTILLAVLRDVAEELTANAIQNLIFQQGSPVTGDVDRFRLILRQRDADFFREKIQVPNGTQTLRINPAKLTDSQRNIRDNALEVQERISGLSTDERNRLAAFVIQKCYLVVVSAADRNAAYRIFAVMNDRGLDLSATDILKAEIIGEVQIDPLQEQRLTKTWEDLEDELGRKDFEDLFAHMRMIFVKQKAKQTLIEEFRENVLPKTKGKMFIEETLVPYAAAFKEILDGKVAVPARGDSINRYLRSLSRLDNADWVPPAIEFISKRRGDDASIANFLRALERLAYSLLLRREYPTERISRYGRVLRAMADGVDLFANGSPLDVTPTERSEALQQLEGPLYLTARIRLPVLLRLDELIAAGGATYDLRVVSVEHVLPQTPAEGSEWLRNYPDVQIRDEWVHRIGNLALLPFHKNSQASNFDFAKKKNIYFSRGGVVAFPLTVEIVHEADWTIDVIKRRQTQLVGRLLNEWKLGPNDSIETALKTPAFT